jgi:hypothetical protein
MIVMNNSYPATKGFNSEAVVGYVKKAVDDIMINGFLIQS